MRLRLIEVTPCGPKLMGVINYQTEYIHHEISGDFNDCAIIYIRRP